MKRQFAVIGLGRFGYHIAKTLADMGAEVAAIDKDKDKVDQVSDFVTLAYQLDATDEKALRAVGLQNVDVGIVSIGEDIEASILVVMTLKEMGVKEIVAKGLTDIHGRILKHLGVHKVVYPEA
jgi:trk system potassium uptake protein TrkA